MLSDCEPIAEIIERLCGEMIAVEHRPRRRQPCEEPTPDGGAHQTVCCTGLTPV